jgi:hypothetical protein
MPTMIKGNELPAALQAKAKRMYSYRFTGENTPAWAKEEWKDGVSYPLQFADDADWLANSEFPVTKKGEFAVRGDMRSTPTWPNNPELRN